MVGHWPRVSTPCLPDVIAHDQISHASPHHIDQILAVEMKLPHYCAYDSAVNS